MSSDDAQASRAGKAPRGPRGAAQRPGRKTGKQRGRRQRPLWLRVLLGTLAGFVALFALGVIAFVILYVRIGIPQPQAGASNQLSILYYSDGKTELDRFSTVNRQDVQLSDVPQQVQYEFLSAEDRSFYTNKGISPKGMIRALWVNLRGGQEQGGSTITQQYVKNYFLTQDQTLTRKLKEAIISIKVDQQYSKKQILQDYLNNTYFGRNAYGIQAASQAYFRKDVSKLTPAEGAFLASVINAPGLYDPQYGANALSNAQRRWNYVLDGMVSQHWMSQSERSSLTFPTIQKPQPRKYGSGPTGYITAAVRAELKSKLHLSDADIDRGGLRITTTIDKQDQQSAVSAVQKNISADTYRLFALHTGLVAESPDGAVVAMYGGRDYLKSQFSTATQATMQGGSSFKVFTTVAALQNGMSLHKTYSGRSPLKIGDTTFTNDQNEQFGMIDMTTALAHSVNTYYVQLNKDLGPGKTLTTAERLGIPAGDPGMNQPNTSDVLGTASVHVIDMANAYNTVSTGGKKATPYFIKKVTSTVGSYSYQASPQQDQVVDKTVANDTTNAMSKVITEGTAAQTVGAHFQRPAAGKTGTSSYFKSAWFTGFTPGQLTASVGIYRGDGSESLKGINGQDFYGGTVPAQIWTDFMNAALKGEPVAALPGLSPGNQSSSPAPSTTSSSSSSSTTSSTSATTSTSTSTPPSSTSTSTSTSTPPPSTTTQPSSTPPATTSAPVSTPPPASTTAAPGSSAPPAGARASAPAASLSSRP